MAKNPKSYTNIKKAKINKIAVSVIVGLVLVIVAYILLKPQFFSDSSKVLATVGEEQIFKSYLDFEIKMHPQSKDPEVEKTLLNKIIADSITLQAAAKENVIGLDPKFFNNSKPDYPARLQEVARAQEQINNRSSKVKGSMVSIWFLNAGLTGPKGYEASKTEARRKLTPIYEKVKAGEITMQQARDLIINDESLYDLDMAYKSNAYLEFDTGRNDQISFDNEFNEKIKQLNTGEITQITALKEDSPSPKYRGQTLEVLYAFAKVEDKTSGSFTNFESWLEDKKNTYQVTIL